MTKDIRVYPRANRPESRNRVQRLVLTARAVLGAAICVQLAAVALAQTRGQIGKEKGVRVHMQDDETHNVVRQTLKPICKRLGIEEGGMHAFRHGRVSHLQQNGVPPDFTKSQVGHSSLRTTGGYTHFSTAFSRELVERLAAKL